MKNKTHTVKLTMKQKQEKILIIQNFTSARFKVVSGRKKTRED